MHRQTLSGYEKGGNAGKERHDLPIPVKEAAKTGVSLIDEQHEMLVSLISVSPGVARRCPGGDPFTLFTALKHHMGAHHDIEPLVLRFCEPAYAGLYELQYQDGCRRLLKAESLLRQRMDPGPVLELLSIWWLHHVDAHGEYFLPGFPGSAREH